MPWVDKCSVEPGLGEGLIGERLVTGDGFCLGYGTLDQLYTLSMVLERALEFGQLVHVCFLDLENTASFGVSWLLIDC